MPLDAPVEGGAGSDGDRHVLVLQQGTCELFELGVAYPSGAGWTAVRRCHVGPDDRRAAAARPGPVPMLPGCPSCPAWCATTRWPAGAIRHAIRVTFAQTQRGFILPATHFASSRTDPDLPPMGLRLRLSASFDVTALTGQSRVIAEAMQRYGLIVADNGSNWFFQGAPDPALGRRRPRAS